MLRKLWRSIQYIKRYYGTRLPGIYDSAPTLPPFSLLLSFCLLPPSQLLPLSVSSPPTLVFISFLDILMTFLFDHWIYIFVLFFSWGGGRREGVGGRAGGRGRGQVG